MERRLTVGFSSGFRPIRNDKGLSAARSCRAKFSLCRAPTVPMRTRASLRVDLIYAANLVGISVVALRTASDMATRVMPLKIMLTPTRVPIAQAELEGHCS
jgi:hypothetical protein